MEAKKFFCSNEKRRLKGCLFRYLLLAGLNLPIDIKIKPNSVLNDLCQRLVVIL